MIHGREIGHLYTIGRPHRASGIADMLGEYAGPLVIIPVIVPGDVEAVAPVVDEWENLSPGRNTSCIRNCRRAAPDCGARRSIPLRENMPRWRIGRTAVIEIFHDKVVCSHRHQLWPGECIGRAQGYSGGAPLQCTGRVEFLHDNILIRRPCYNDIS